MAPPGSCEPGGVVVVVGDGWWNGLWSLTRIPVSDDPNETLERITKIEFDPW